MSYGFRTPQEKVLSTLNPTLIDGVASFSGRIFEENESRLGKYFNYHLSDKKKEFASQAGIYLSPYSFQSHSHPLCKTIENYLLFVVMPPLISNFDNLYVVSMKESKLKILHSNSQLNGISLNLINRLIDVKDNFRYKDGGDFSVKYPTTLLKSNAKGYDPILDCQIQKGKNFLFHDEMHYWSFEMMLDFLDKFEPNNVICSVVYPIEILSGVRQSLFPDIYSFQMVGNDKFTFAPDSCYSESYEQTVDMKWLFSASSFVVNGKYFSVDLIKTVGAHHLFAITAGKRVTKAVRIFREFDILDLSAFSGTKYKIPVVDVHFSFFKKIVIYLKSLKKPDSQSAVAKLRQLVGENISLTEMLFIEDFAERFQSLGSAKFSIDGVFDQMAEAIKNSLPMFFRKMLGSFGRDNIMRQIALAEPFSITIKTVRVDKNFDNSSVVRFLRGFFEVPVERLQSDSLLYPGLDFDTKKGIWSPGHDTHDRSNLVHKYTPSLHSSLIDGSEIGSKFYIRRFYHGRTDVTEGARYIYKSNHSIRDFDLKLLEARRRYMDQMEIKFPWNFQRDARNFLPFFMVKKFRKLPQLTWHSVKCDETFSILDDMLEVLNETPLEIKSLIVPEEPIASLISETENEDTKLILDTASVVSNDSISEGSTVFDEGRREKIDNENLKNYPFDMALESQCLDVPAFIENLKAKKIKTRKSYFFCKNSEFDYGHDKYKYENLGWPKLISDICNLSEKKTGIKFNSVLINSYCKGGKIFYHADDEHVYDLERNPVFTINAKGKGLFKFKRNSDAEVTEVRMDEGDSVLMKDGAQIRGKHSVHALSTRISLTLRNQIRSYSKKKDLDALKEDDLTDLKESCLIRALAKEIKISEFKLSNLIISEDYSYLTKIKSDKGMTIDDLEKISNLLCLKVRVLIDGQWNYFGVSDSNFRGVSLRLTGSHFEPYEKESIKIALGNEMTNFKVKHDDGAFFEKFLNRIDPKNEFVNRFQRVIDFDRAAKLIDSFLKGTTGVICSSSFGLGVTPFSGREKNLDHSNFSDPKFLKKLVGDDFLIKGSAIIGFAGCGKSRPVQMALNNLDSPIKIMVISPRVNLLEDWKKKVENKNVFMKTYESALKENFAEFSLIIIDEFLLTPRGYLDVAAFKGKMDSKTCKVKAKVPKFILLGDPLQAGYYNDLDDHLLPAINELETLEIEIPRYLFYTHRMSSSMSSIMEVPMLGEASKEANLVIYNSAAAAFSEKAFDVILVASRQEKNFFANYTVMTFGESQGLTFDKVAIALSEDTLLCSDNHVIVALTRARKQISLIKCFGYDEREFFKRAGTKLIGKVLNKRKIRKAQLENMIGLEDLKLVTIEPKFGTQEERTEGDPWMKGLLTHVQEVILENCEAQMAKPDDIKMKVHVPITDKSFALTILNDQIRAREYREFKVGDSWSTQFKDDDKNIKLESSTGPVNFEAIFPRHTSFDDVTFWAAVKKRLTFSNPITEGEKLKKAFIKGGILFNEFEKVIRVSGEFRPDLFEKALEDFERIRVSKSKKLIEAHAGRSDPDWDVNRFLLFMKSQLCKKAEKAFSDAKAGQTIACFAHGVLFKFSAWARYAELKMMEKMPDSFYIHSRKNFDELEEWVKRNFIGPICVESDYEAFDSSQDATILAFEMKFLEKVGWPRDLIEDYRDLKMNLGCKLGNLAIMRFTGEFGTFFLNTLANMAFTFCRYNINRSTPICFAGDDMCILTDAKVRHDLDEFISSLKLKAKVEWKINPIFCGWILSRYGILKLPSLVYYRLCIALEKGNLKDCIDSYMIEAGYAYRKGAYIDELLTEEQMNFHQLVIRRMIKAKHLMKGSSVNILNEIQDVYSDGVDD